jgi:hypothetical protein
MHECWSGADRPSLSPFAIASRLVSCILSHLIQSKILSELSGSIFLLTASVHASVHGFDS